jgi:YD repeat-containing protein
MGTNHPYELSEFGSRYPYTYIEIVLEDAETVRFDRVSKGTGFADAVYAHTATASEFYDARISWNGDGWTLALRDGHVFLLPEAYNAKTLTQAAVVEMRNAQGQRIRFDREAGTRNLRRLTSPSGHAITFEYTGSGQVDRATDDLGHSADYYYDSEKRLYAVSRSDGHAYRFAYNRDMLTTISDEKRRVLLEIGYTEDGRVEEERVGDGSVYHYRYMQNQKGAVEQVFVTSPDGAVYAFDHGALMSRK